MPYSLSTVVVGQTLTEYEGYYLTQPPYPVDDTRDWHPNHVEGQGLTNDGVNWFFTFTQNDGTNAFLWKVPVSIPLASDIIGQPGVISKAYANVPSLQTGGYQHWGDPDHYNYAGTDYILVPITGNGTPIIACFLASNLSFVNYSYLDPTKQSDVGWCAIQNNGVLFTSSDNASSLLRYNINWNTLVNTTNHNAITWLQTYPLMNQNGVSMTLYNMQGGEFSPSGELLYLVAGSGQCLGFGNGIYSSDGIHVIETANWKEIKRSNNSDKTPGNFYFNYTFYNGCACFSGSQTPEGLTIWDLDNGTAPNVRGQLHVMVNFYNEWAACTDAISLHHFSRNFYIDKANGSPNGWSNPLTGTKNRPFQTVAGAYSFYPIWDGAKMVIQAANYNETVYLNKRIKISSKGGSAIIGKP